MLKWSLALMLFLFSTCVWAQYNVKIVVKDDANSAPLAGASVTVPALHKGAITDSNGQALLKNLPAGTFELEVSYIGYSTLKRKVTFPYADPVLQLKMEKHMDEDENPEVVVTATRTDRSVRNTPTRVEVIAGGEISENISMRPGEIKMLLNETTGIITQPTSAVSGMASLRIQELDGRYTQLLRDGFPLYSGLSEGLSLVQIAPLDLKQVEIIKGSSSTLYGGGAIAGLVNLVSKTPTDKQEISFLANGTSTHGLDLSGFYSQKYGKLGVTVFTARNSSDPYDPSGTGFTAIPKFIRYTLTPRIFFYGKHTSVNAGVSLTTEDRLGGNINVINTGVPGYVEQNHSNRLTTQAAITQELDGHGTLSFKNSFNFFDRNLTLPGYQFGGRQQSSFSEMSYNGGHTTSFWVAGVNLYTDRFDEVRHAAGPARDYQYITAGAFVQNTWSPADVFSMESGLRADYTDPFGCAILPRVSFLMHFSPSLTSRVGGGLGYRLPTIFTEESEERDYKNILPVNVHQMQYERSAGANADLSWRVSMDEIKLTLNPLLFYTRINRPLVLQDLAGGASQFVNANGFTDSKGLDVSMRLSLDHISFFTGYSYTVAENHFNGEKTWYPLAPHHRLHFDLVYEIEGKLRVAFESYYTGTQQLRDSTPGRPYWLLGALIEKSWKHFSVFINSEDLNNVRQTRWESIYTGSMDNPSFKDIYAPLEGTTVNAGVKIKL